MNNTVCFSTRPGLLLDANCLYFCPRQSAPLRFSISPPVIMALPSTCETKEAWRRRREQALNDKTKRSLNAGRRDGRKKVLVGENWIPYWSSTSLLAIITHYGANVNGLNGVSVWDADRNLLRREASLLEMHIHERNFEFATIFVIVWFLFKGRCGVLVEAIYFNSYFLSAVFCAKVMTVCKHWTAHHSKLKAQMYVLFKSDWFSLCCGIGKGNNTYIMKHMMKYSLRVNGTQPHLGVWDRWELARCHFPLKFPLKKENHTSSVRKNKWIDKRDMTQKEHKHVVRPLFIQLKVTLQTAVPNLWGSWHSWF